MVPVLQACAAGQQAAAPIRDSQDGEAHEGEEVRLQSLLQVSDNSARIARGGAAVLNKHIGVPARAPRRK
jgi:hypothetical protein